MRMSLDMTDIIIAFTANREITGCIENKLHPQENEQFVADRIRVVEGGEPPRDAVRRCHKDENKICT